MKYFIAVLVLVCAVQALAQSNGDIRLVEGVSSSIGRVQVYFQGQWGAMCVDFCSSRPSTAHVICRSLGFSDSRPIRFHVHRVDPSAERILLDRVCCNGNEHHILQCVHGPFGESDCTHNEEMAVDCYGGYIGSTVELRDGTTSDGVLVLGNNHGEKGTVCNRYWDFRNSVVACRSLGQSGVGISPISLDRAYYGETTEPSGLSHLSSQFMCYGHEADLTQCVITGIHHERGNCTHNRDVALDCHGSENIQVSLIDGSDTWGSVRVVYRGESHPICVWDNTMPDNAPKVVCRMLGYGNHQGVQLRPREVPSGIKAFNGTFCQGSEKNIAECGMHLRFEESCTHALAIKCLPQPDIAVRLVDGNGTYGRLEIQRNGQWGGACSYSGRGLAMVVCRMLQYPTENAAIRFTRLPPSDLVVVYSTVCAGDEANLNYCDLGNRPITDDCAGRHYVAWINCA